MNDQLVEMLQGTIRIKDETIEELKSQIEEYRSNMATLEQAMSVQVCEDTSFDDYINQAVALAAALPDDKASLTDSDVATIGHVIEVLNTLSEKLEPCQIIENKLAMLGFPLAH